MLKKIYVSLIMMCIGCAASDRKAQAIIDDELFRVIRYCYVLAQNPLLSEDDVTEVIIIARTLDDLSLRYKNPTLTTRAECILLDKIDAEIARLKRYRALVNV